MTAEVFLDSNIFLYSCSDSPADAEKQAISETLIMATNFALSVLQEFVSNTLRKKVLGISESQIDAALEMAGHVPVFPITLELILAAATLRRRWQLSHWDSTIIAAAQELGCHTLYSEDLNHGAFTVAANEDPFDFKVSPKDKSNMPKYLFGGFKKCLYPVQKFDSEGERILSVILEREAEKWFKPAKGQFQIFYKSGSDYPKYQPDFVAETGDALYMLEPKRRSELNDAIVLAKKDAVVEWCQHATTHTAKHGGKPWIYCLVAHDIITENMSIDGLG